MKLIDKLPLRIIYDLEFFKCNFECLKLNV